MGNRKTQLDLTVEKLEAERAVLDLAIAKLREQQKKQAAAKRATQRPAAVEKVG